MKRLFYCLTVVTTLLAPMVGQAEMRSSIAGDRDAIKAEKQADGTIKLEYCTYQGACTRLGSRNYRTEELKALSGKERLVGNGKIAGEVIGIPVAAFATMALIDVVFSGAASLYATGGLTEAFKIGSEIGFVDNAHWLAIPFAVVAAPGAAYAVYHFVDPRTNLRISRAVSLNNINNQDIVENGSVKKTASDVDAVLKTLK